MKKIILIGPESTGKTTLALLLSKRFSALFIPESLREFYETQLKTQGELQYIKDDLKTIAVAQEKAESSSLAGEIQIIDSGLVSLLVYSRHYYGESPTWLVDAIHRQRYTLHLLLKPDVPWVSDPLRDRKEQRDELYQLFESTLNELQLPYFKIAGDWTEREKRSVERINQILSS